MIFHWLFALSFITCSLLPFAQAIVPEKQVLTVPKETPKKRPESFPVIDEGFSYTEPQPPVKKPITRALTQGALLGFSLMRAWDFEDEDHKGWFGVSYTSPEQDWRRWQVRLKTRGATLWPEFNYHYVWKKDLDYLLYFGPGLSVYAPNDEELRSYVRRASYAVAGHVGMDYALDKKLSMNAQLSFYAGEEQTQVFLSAALLWPL